MVSHRHCVSYLITIEGSILCKHYLCDANAPNIAPDIAPCFVLPANPSLVGILHNNDLSHGALAYSEAHSYYL
jgi:hypothetical protein